MSASHPAHVSIPRPRRRGLAALLLALAALAVLALAPATLAQDDPDFDLGALFTDPRDRYHEKMSLVDLDTDAQGNLVAAFVSKNLTGDALVLALRDHATGDWKEIAHFGWAWNYDEIRDLVLAVGSGLGPSRETKAFIAVQYVERGYDVLALFEGPLDRPWKHPELRGTRLRHVSQAAPGQPGAANPDLALIPYRAEDYERYALALSYTLGGGGEEGHERVMLTLLHDEGEFYEGEERPLDYWDRDTWTVAGAGAAVLNEGRFGRASVAADEQNGRWTIAVEELDARRTHVLSGPPSDDMTRPLNEELIWSSWQGARLGEPELAIDRGEASLALLGERRGDGSAPLYLLYSQAVWTPNSFFDSGTLHEACRTPADMDVRRDDAFITADCVDQRGTGDYRVHAFEGERDLSWRWPPVVVGDGPADPIRPRAATPPRGAGFSFGAYAWGVEYAAPYGYGPQYRSLWLDP